MATKWIHLDEPQVALNAPNVQNNFLMKYSYVIPWDWDAEKIFRERVPQGVKHLVFNCHGFTSRPNFGAPHLSLGTVLHPGNVGTFKKLFDISTLCMIWISSCGISGSAAGLEFCKEMAKNSGCFVVTQQTGVPDIPVRLNCVIDYERSLPQYISPKGEMISRSDFFELGRFLDFKKL
jgi:hypothetical protein